ncbi:MAG: tetratricopeptide repeat protein [Ilumatobacter sp.]
MKLPTGVVTFLFTDIEGSTVRWEDSPDAMRDALSRHNEIMRAATERHDGVVFETAGDSFVIAFAAAPSALAAAVWAQRELHREPWAASVGSLRVRMALHTGHAEMQPDGYFAQHTLSRQARLLSTGHGGQVLLSRATRDRVVDALPSSVGLRAMGRIWLKDLVEPEEVFQVVAPSPPWSLPSDFAPLQSDRSPPGNLPSAAVPFIGRAGDVDEVADAVTAGASRVTTLLGPGGIGKTRLALRVAERVQHHFQHGVYFVDLAAVTDPEVAIATIASTVGSGDDLAGGAAALGKRLGDHRLLLVLDNLEQVIDVAVDVAQLLVHAPSVRVVATSRIPLRILEESEYRVDPLGLVDPHRDVDLKTIERTDSVRLFVDRSRASSRDFELTEENASAVAAICRRLEGMPLAIVLAAARSKTLQPAEMLDRLEHRLNLLTEGARDLPDRHQALRDTIEWSYELLDERERALYARVSVHAGGFRRDAAEAVAGASAVAAHLDALVEASLVHVADTFDGDIRYRMLETIAEHAREKLVDRGGVAEAEYLHARHFLGLAEEAVTHAEDEQAAEWTARLDEEHDNARAALASLATGGTEQIDDVRCFVRFTAAMGLYWLDRGHLREGIGRLERATTLVASWIDAADDHAERADAQRAFAEIADVRGLIARRRDDLDEAREWLERAVEAYHALGEVSAEARTLVSLGTVSFHGGDFDEARAVYDRSLELSGSTGDRNTAAALSALGNLERDVGNAAAARELYERSLEIDIAINDLLSVSVSVNNLANLALDAGEFDRARELHVRSLEIRNQLGVRIMLAESLVGLAAVAIGLGQPTRAARLIGFAQTTAEMLGAEFDPMERRIFARTVGLLRTTLGEETFSSEARLGAGMTDADAVDYARSD